MVMVDLLGEVLGPLTDYIGARPERCVLKSPSRGANPKALGDLKAESLSKHMKKKIYIPHIYIVNCFFEVFPTCGRFSKIHSYDLASSQEMSPVLQRKFRSGLVRQMTCSYKDVKKKLDFSETP